MLNELQKPLTAKQIDFRVQSINKGQYVTILAYKDARVDMERLDEVVGALNWKREHSRDNHNCTVSIYNREIEQWISKEDTGTESQADAQKGLASDSFKRACFNWGIGRELYDYPLIQFKLKDSEVKKVGDKFRPSWNFNLRDWEWYTEFVDNKLSFIACRDSRGAVRWKWGEMKDEKSLKKESKTEKRQYNETPTQKRNREINEKFAELEEAKKNSDKKSADEIWDWGELHGYDQVLDRYVSLFGDIRENL